MRPSLGSLSLPHYRWFVLSTLTSSMAFQSQQIAMGWLAYDLTKSPLALGLVLICWGIPATLFSLVGGVIADRGSRRHTMAVMTAATAVAALAIGILATMNQVALWHLLVSGVLSGTAIALNMPSRQAFIFDIVGPENIADAVAINAGGFSAMRLVSPALSGFLIGAIGVDTVYYLVVLFYVISTVMLLLPLKRVAEVVRTPAYPAKEMADGFRYIKREKPILWLLIVALVTMFVGLPFSNLMPAFAVESLSQGPEGYGLLMSMVGLGAILGSLITLFLGTVRRPRLLLIASVFAWGTSLTAFSMSGHIIIAASLAVVLGIMSTGSSTINNILIHTEVDDNFRGRVMSFYMLTFSMGLVGTLPTGALAELVGTTAALTWSGVILVFLCVPLSLWARTFIAAKQQSASPM